MQILAAATSVCCADLDGATPPPTGSPMVLVALNDARDQIELYQYAVDWVDPTATRLLGPAVLQTGPWDGNMCSFSRDCIPQPNTPTRLDAFARQSVMYRAAYRNFGNRESLLLTHTVDATGQDRAGIRWYEIGSLQRSRLEPGQPVLSSGQLARWMVSIASVAAATSPSATAIFRPISVDSLHGPPLLRYADRWRGSRSSYRTGEQTASNRWGDYSQDRDPQDDCTFWFTSDLRAYVPHDCGRRSLVRSRVDPTLPPRADGPAPYRSVRDAPVRSAEPRIDWRCGRLRSLRHLQATRHLGSVFIAHVLNRRLAYTFEGRQGRLKVAPCKYDYTIDAPRAATCAEEEAPSFPSARTCKGQVKSPRPSGRASFLSTPVSSGSRRVSFVELFLVTRLPLSRNGRPLKQL